MKNKGKALALSLEKRYAPCMNPQNGNPFATLQANASELFQKIQGRHGKQMRCSEKCSRCCEADFSVFSGEAQLIWEAFDRLSIDERQKKSQILSQNLPKTKGKCAFLIEGHCSVYEERPVICRTQGAPLCLNDEVKKTKSLTACSLNFDDPAGLPSTPESWVDLNRLTELQSIAERFFKGQGHLSPALSPLVDSDNRIRLRDLCTKMAEWS